ncbi:MAG: M15 family metallopeptidase [Treponemataceae bacterium]
MNKNYICKKVSVMLLFVFFVTSFFAQAGRYERKLQAIVDSMNYSEKDKILANQSTFLVELEFLLRNDNDNLLILVDKKHLLPPTYVPTDLIPLEKNNLFAINRNDLSLRKTTFEALQAMARDAQKDNVNILVSSTYRSYDYQKNVYERHVQSMGKKEADRVSAAAGTSQHQLGTVIDFGSITDEFAQTKAGKWVFDNAERYGFSLSFPANYEHVTGYVWESWHYRYIGKEAVDFQKKWFGNIQQYMMEFIDAWKRN